MAASNQPDVVRLVDCNLRKKKQQQQRQEQEDYHQYHEPEPKYKNDENVLESLPAQYRQIETGEAVVPGEYVADSGLVIPAISLDLRQRIDEQLKLKGISEERLTEVIARSTVELSIQLFGGSHRLNPTNTHQIPTVVILAGPNRAGV